MLVANPPYMFDRTKSIFGLAYAGNVLTKRLEAIYHSVPDLLRVVETEGNLEDRGKRINYTYKNDNSANDAVHHDKTLIANAVLHFREEISESSPPKHSSADDAEIAK